MDYNGEPEPVASMAYSETPLFQQQLLSPPHDQLHFSNLYFEANFLSLWLLISVPFFHALVYFSFFLALSQSLDGPLTFLSGYMVILIPLALAVFFHIG